MWHIFQKKIFKDIVKTVPDLGHLENETVGLVRIYERI